jgi:flagellar protein FlgJ
MINGVSAKVGALADPKATELDQLKAAAKQFEAIFTRQMLKSTRDAKLCEDDLFSSDATDQFREMQDGNLADQLSEKGSLGIADLLVRQFQARVGKPAATTAGAPATDTGTAPAQPEASAKTDGATG